MIPRCAAPALVLAVLATPLAAQHGTEAWGRPLGARSGATLELNTYDLGLTTELTWFDARDASALNERAFATGRAQDSAEQLLLQRLTLRYGMHDELQYGIRLGYAFGSGFRRSQPGTAGATSSSGEPDGVSDAWLDVQYRFVHDADDSLSVLGGFKLPIGKEDARLDDGARFDASNQPGTGAFDQEAGLAWTRALDARTRLDLSALYTLRGDEEGFELGDRIDAGARLSCRLNDAAREPVFTLSGELLGAWLSDDRVDGRTDPDSGGLALFAAPALEARFTPRARFHLGVLLPVWIDLNGYQDEPLGRVTFGFAYAF